MTSAADNSGALAHITIAAFDVHLWSEPFDPTRFNPRVHFLWSAAEYQAMRAAGQNVDLGDLILFPLKNESMPKRNHFWRRYDTAVGKLSPGPATPLGDARDFLWPLRCRPKGLRISFGASKAAVPPGVWTTIWLWPFGWSSVVEFKVTAPFSLNDLRDLGVKLRGTEPGPFVLDGKALSLSGIFRRLADTVRQNIGVPGNVPEDSTRVTRSVVIALQLPRGTAARGYDPGPSDGPPWPVSDRRRMLSALRGRDVSTDDIVGKNDFFSTPLGGKNFAVTDFNEGTLLVLRHWKDRPDTKRETNHCLVANLRTFSAVHLTLHNFIRYWNDQADLARCVVNAKQLIGDLSKEYQNRLSLDFKKHYSPRG